MKKEQIIAELERLAKVMGITVRYEKMGRVAGGLCRVDDELFLFINKSLNPQSKIELFVQELKNLDWEKHFIVPEVRRLFE